MGLCHVCCCIKPPQQDITLVNVAKIWMQSRCVSDVINTHFEHIQDDRAGQYPNFFPRYSHPNHHDITEYRDVFTLL